jgi:hypothetical protein
MLVCYSPGRFAGVDTLSQTLFRLLGQIRVAIPRYEQEIEVDASSMRLRASAGG